MSSAPDGPRFSEWTPTNHQAPLWITTCLSLIYSCSFLAVRVVVKIRRWALDDVVLGAAYLVSFAQWALVYAALHQGAGKSSDNSSPHSLETPGKLVFSSTLLTLLSLGLTKCSTILFLRMVFTRESKKAWQLCDVFLITFGCWTVASVLIVSIGCSPQSALDSGSASQCPGEAVRWVVVTAIDVFLELSTVILSAYLFSTLHMKLSTKFTVTGAFGFRLGVPAFFIAYAVGYISFRSHGRPSIDAVNSLVLQQSLLAYSLMAATVPCLRNFLGRFRTGDLTRLSESEIMQSDNLQEWTSSRSRSRPQQGQGSHVLSSMDGSRLGKVRRTKNQISAILQSDAGGDTSSSHAWADRQNDNSSGGSERMIITRTVDFDVEHR